MKLIFKIYKKVRELKREERELKKNIERYKLDSNKYLKEEEIKLKRSILNLKEESRKERLRHEQECNENYSREIALRGTRIDFESVYSVKRENALDQREKELNELQHKINDQILKLGIVNGVNK